MTNKITFYLARHGQTEWNVEHRIQGQLNSKLTKVGRAQAQTLATACLPVGITHLLSSPLGRAMETAEICGQVLHLSVKSVIGFEERNFGLWQGKKITEVNTLPYYMEATTDITDFQPPQAESAKEMLFRFETALKKELKAAHNETSLMIIHGDILRCFMDQFIEHTGGNKKMSNGFDYPNAQLIALSYDPILDSFYKG